MLNGVRILPTRQIPTNHYDEWERRRGFIALYDHGNVLKTRPWRSSKANAGDLTQKNAAIQVCEVEHAIEVGFYCDNLVTKLGGDARITKLYGWSVVVPQREEIYPTGCLEGYGGIGIIRNEWTHFEACKEDENSSEYVRARIKMSDNILYQVQGMC